MDTKDKITLANNRFYTVYIKRALDIMLALLGILILLPVFLLIAVAIICEDGFPFFYRGERAGKDNITFRIFKFRSMVKNAESLGGDTTGLFDNRITKVGQWLRKTKLDELPQLFNVLLGQMSFVGPRPELPRYTANYSDEEKVILKVLPGITDYSSLKFINLDEIVGNENPVEMYEKLVLKEKNQLRIKYAKTVSFFNDSKILLLTLQKVVQKIYNYISYSLGEGKGIP